MYEKLETITTRFLRMSSQNKTNENTRQNWRKFISNKTFIYRDVNPWFLAPRHVLKYNLDESCYDISPIGYLDLFVEYISLLFW